MQWKEFRSHLSHLSDADQARVEKAFAMGQAAHAGQKRKSGEPYFTHPVAVAIMLTEEGADSDTIIAALLHDTVEDTFVTLEDIDRAFGQDVRTLIDGVTKLERADIGEKPALDEQIETLRKMFVLFEKDVRIMVIKLMDRLHNMRTAEHLAEDRRRLLAEETLEIYVKIADRLCMQRVRDELEELCYAIVDPSLHGRLVALRTSTEADGKGIAQRMETVMRQKTGDPSIEAFPERKQWSRLRAQLDIGASAATGISAHTTVFLAQSIEDCYRILGALHQAWPRETLSFQDFINTPRINGYRGLHTTIILEDGTRVRCKIRTREMHAYARSGVAAVCFGAKAGNMLDYIPWTAHIGDLSRNTAQRSQEFWQSLRSDVLEESIIIHGPGDEAALVPKGGTVLDGAFHLFERKALRAKVIRMNGKTVPFYTPLQNAATVEIDCSNHRTVTHEWIEWTHTGFSQTRIHDALGEEDATKKASEGRRMLQAILSERRRGYLEEFDEGSFAEGLRGLGYGSLREALIAIGDGRLHPAAAFSALFERSKEDVTALSTVRYSFPLGDHDVVMELVKIYNLYRSSLKSIRLRLNPLTGMATATCQLLLSPQALQEYLRSIRAAGATGGRVVPRGIMGKWKGLLVAFLFLLWGLDPVMGRLLVRTYGVSTIDLTIVRFLSLMTISGCLLLFHRLRCDTHEVRLHLGHRSLWLSSGLLLTVAVATYQALQQTTPLQYTIPMTAAGLLLTSIVHRRRRIILAITWSLLALGMLILTRFSEWNMEGILATISAVAAFSAFSIVSERYKREAHVGIRSAQYFFLLSTLCVLFTIPLLPFATVLSLPAALVVKIVGFSLIFTGLPYYMYYHLLSHHEIDFILRFSFVIMFTTALGQSLWPQSGVISKPVILALALVTAGSLLPLLHSTRKASPAS